jgi:hypothetical protein
MYIVHWKSIDTGKKYRCFDISAPAIFFHFGQRHRHDNRIPKSLKRRKYYKSSSFSMVLNGSRAGWEFLVMLVAITDIHFSMFILLALLPLLKIKNSLFVVMVVRVGKISLSASISIKNGKYRGNIVSNEKAGIAHPYYCVGFRGMDRAR